MNDKLSDKPRRVLRGGSWLKDSKDTRSAVRFRNDPRSRNADNGFRVLTATVDLPAPAPSTPAKVKPVVLPENPNPVVPEAVRPVAPPELDAQPSPKSTYTYPMQEKPTAWWVPTSVLAALGYGGWKLKKFFASRAEQRLHTPPSVIPAENRGHVDTRIRIRTTEDGFYIVAEAPAGTQLHWTCVVDGLGRHGTLDYVPGPDGQFVFTGWAPEGVHVEIGNQSRFYFTGSEENQTSLGRPLGMFQHMQGLHLTQAPPLPAQLAPSTVDDEPPIEVEEPRRRTSHGPSNRYPSAY